MGQPGQVAAATVEAGTRQRRQRLAPAERMPLILAAAIEEFAERGYAGAGMAAVAGRAGVAKGLLYHYFPGGKADLFMAAVRGCVAPKLDEAERLIAAFQGPRREMLRSLIITGYARMAENPREQVLFKLIIAESDRFPELADFYSREVLARATAIVRAALRAGIETGEFRADAADQPGLAHVVLAPAIMGSVWRMMLGEHRAPDLGAMREAHIDMVLRALAPAAAPPEPDHGR
jgi:AcrR family transcriptional regulator